MIEEDGASVVYSLVCGVSDCPYACGGQSNWTQWYTQVQIALQLTFKVKKPTNCTSCTADVTSLV